MTSGDRTCDLTLKNDRIIFVIIFGALSIVAYCVSLRGPGAETGSVRAIFENSGLFFTIQTAFDKLSGELSRDSISLTSILKFWIFYLEILKKHMYIV